MRIAQPRDRGETASNRRVARITLTEQVACRKAARQAPESRVRLWPSPACTGRLAAKPEALNIAALHEALEQVLAANPGKSYCPGCLAKAAGFTLPEDEALRMVSRTWCAPSGVDVCQGIRAP